MRWLAIAHWQPFAAMIISLALLGHGASGTWLALARERALRRFDVLFAGCAAGFAVAVVVALMLARAIPFNGLELVWNPRQLGWLAALYLALSLPFLLAASCFGLAFARFPAHIPKLYGADLLGAGAGALLAVALLWAGPVAWGLAAAALLACVGAAIAALGAARPRRMIAMAVFAAALVALALPAGVLAPEPNPFKGLRKTLLLPGARVTAERHSPYAWLAVVESPRVPLRHAPGLSLANTQEPPPQLGVFADGDGMRAITRDTGDAAALGWLARTTSALPYHVFDRPLARPRVLVLGAGAGQDVLQALVLGAREVIAVEPNPQLVDLVRTDYTDYAGGLYRDSRVRVRTADARGFLRADRGAYELIVLAQADSFAGSASGASATAENYALTVEALREARARLAPGGLIAVTYWQKLPPRDELKLIASAIAALQASGVAEPGARLAAIRGWNTGTLLIGERAFDAGALQRLRAFCARWSFDPVHYPGMRAAEANVYNVVERVDAYAGVRALLSPRRADFLAAYKFDIAPATDDRPWFADFFAWRTLPELWALRAQGGAVLLDAGYLLLLAALAQALPLALVLVLLPLAWLPRAAHGTPQTAHSTQHTAHGAVDDVQEATASVPQAASMSRARCAGYFLCLGLAFLFIEIACLSRLTLLVGHPLLAITVGLAGFLVCAGLGSLSAQRRPRPIATVVIGLALALGLHFAVFALAREAAAWPLAARAALGLVSIAPLAFAMGMPFPLGLSRLARTAPAFVPWAWGINGCASVIAAIAALLLAIEAGLTATLLIALALYALAAWLWRDGKLGAM